MEDRKAEIRRVICVNPDSSLDRRQYIVNASRRRDSFGGSIERIFEWYFGLDGGQKEVMSVMDEQTREDLSNYEAAITRQGIDSEWKLGIDVYG